MTKLVGYRWKHDFLGIDWYKEHPADKYLDDSSKLELLELYVLGIPDDLDSEAEVYLFDYNNTN